ncbi:12096_t:CDS:10 [Ambispora gerdemannii]|uniref:12096_t:CDS:1 n=1 Tax=Ambispora gerdemannii TaxID=144530 RepID=A0A9N8W7V3_9GLOM|nr:12096_t:CDS:10 [Ambispora gerdemannii]
MPFTKEVKGNTKFASTSIGFIDVSSSTTIANDVKLKLMLCVLGDIGKKIENPHLMDNNSLIELFESFAGSESDGQKLHILMERCHAASSYELEDFVNELSELLCNSFELYIPTLKTFLSQLLEEYPRRNTALQKFSSLLTDRIIIQNLHQCDILGFGEIFDHCFELLMRVQNDKIAIQITKDALIKILDSDSVLGVLISGSHGRHCLQRIFELNINNGVEKENLLKMVDSVAAIVEQCSEHKNFTPQLSEAFSVYKACSTLIDKFRRYQNAKRSLPPILCNNNEPRYTLLGMSAPQKSSDIPRYLQAFEQQKLNTFPLLMKFSPCQSCQKQELIRFSPDKYSSLMEEKELTDINKTFKQSERIFCLPFEFNENDNLGPWDILISASAKKDMLHLESPLKLKAVMKKLGNISSGAWAKHGLKLMEPSLSIPVYETELHGHDGLKILWQVDYGFSIRSYQLTQLVKVWAVTTNQNRIDNIVEYFKMFHQVYTAEQISRCAVQQIGGNDIISPKIFGDVEEIRSTKNEFYNSQIDDEKLLMIHKMLVSNKFIPLSKNLFKSLVMGGSEFTFQVSKVEYEIIKNPTSAIIIGRSGTGKTTCIVYRLIASYLSNPSHPFAHKRQLFITTSQGLCRRVKKYFYRLRKSAALAEKKMSQAQFYEYARKKEECYDIDLTSNKILGNNKDLSSIPNSFSQLKEDHFPLFITYEKFSEMLEGTYEIDAQKLIQQSKINKEDEDVYNDDEKEFHSKSFFGNTPWTHFVDYNVFKERYWNRLDKDKLDCELVYSEFSIIKGSDPEGKHLSREEYQTVSTKKYPVFFHNRDKIYDLFQRYEKIKALNGDYDSIDRTLAILRCATKKTLRSPHIHEVYIDECQDNQIVDFGLILKIFNCVDSIFLAGDIAQCIAKGSSFRFQNIRALMYKWELTRIQTNTIPHSIKPKQFELNVNYRSHNGILRLAASIIDLIWLFFPESIDRLSREHSYVSGPWPKVYKKFQDFNAFSDGNDIELGAEQVIIVRDEESKSNIKNLIRKFGLVLTVFEAKGMEFNDVLLYNFFTDSPGRRKWRVILTALENQSKGVPTFSHEKHYILSSELKHLYVAVTRARQHICIFDEKSEYIEPICKYWEHHRLVKVDEIGTFSALAKKSDPAEWDRKGENFFELQHYEQAIFCFEKSKNDDNLMLAEAYYLRQLARTSINNSDRDTVISNFYRAADAFRKCSQPIQEGSCYEDINMYDKAVEVYLEWDMFEHAARCYLKVPNFEKAGNYFEKAKKYTEAVVAYKDDRDYEKVIDLMQSHREKIDKKIFNRITCLVNIHYRRVHDTKMSEKALSILPTQEEQTNLLRDHAPEEFQEVCKKNGLFHAAAEDLRLRGKFNEAADMFLRSDNNDNDLIESLQCCLYLCKLKVLKKIMTDPACPNFFKELNDHLSKANNIIAKARLQSIKSSEWESLKEEVQLYNAYLDLNLDGICKYMQTFRKRKDRVTEFRAIIIWLHIQAEDWLHITNPDIQAENWKERLQHLLRMCELAFPFLAPRENDDISKINKDFQDIFVVSEAENHLQKRKISFDNLLVPLLNQSIGEDAIETLDNWYVYDESTLDLTISQFLASYIYELIWEAGQKGRQIQYISSKICFKFMSCRNQDCRKHHVIPTPSILRKRFTLACLQYTVMQRLDVLYCHRLLKEEQSKEVLGPQRFWAERLVDVHIRYQSPQISCPEVIYAVLAELSKSTHYKLIDFAHKVSSEVFKKPDDFSTMFKCMLVLRQLNDKWGIYKFDSEMSKKIMLRYPEELPVGFDYYSENYEAVPVGTRLSLFFSNLYNYRVLDAITNINIFIQYTIKNTKLINMNTSDAFSDLVSLMEFKTSLVFAVGPGYCNFCLPRAYLVNYFDAFTAKPLIPNPHGYNRDGYLVEITNSIDEVQRLLELLILTERVYLTTILRLIRLLVLIGLNETTSETRVIDLFEHWYKPLKDKVFSPTLIRYLNERYMGRLANILHKDLKETDCDSLVIVHYHRGGSSKFSNLEQHGIVKLEYNSIKQFYFALQQIISPIGAKESDSSDIINQLPRKSNDHGQQNTVLPIAFVSDDQNSEKFEISKEAQDSTTEIQVWFRRIHDSSQANEPAIKIQRWFRRALRRQKSRQHSHDPILEKIFKEMLVFCKNECHWKLVVEKKGKTRVNKYHKLLRGLIVQNTVDLIKMQGKMDDTKIKLQMTINNRNSDDRKIDECLELLDELKYNNHYENVKMVLDSLSTSENMTKHLEANLEWLKNESQMADDVLDDVYHWMSKCNDAMKK